jgi:alpha,alpha-trehalase
MRLFRRSALTSVLVVALSLVVSAQQKLNTPFEAGTSNVLEYIHGSWTALERSTSDCRSLTDSKLGGNTSVTLYVPKGMKESKSVAALKDKCGVVPQQLPMKIQGIGTVPQERIRNPGLLYLPHPYVVPGGRFNEMYGWDSYFIIRGLIADGRREIARGIVENFFFEIDNYGAVLNANRTYYLTRSQPPFLTSMILAVFGEGKDQGKKDLGWLARAYEHAKADYKLWTTGPKFDTETGLSRYFDFGEGPVPEIGDHADYYQTVADWLVKHPETKTDYLTRERDRGAGSGFRVPRCGKEACAKSEDVWLTPAYYQGDRAMRESGFDISFRFGPFSGSTQEFAPVCLNSLLYKAETDLAQIATLLGKKDDVLGWQKRAELRKGAMAHYEWNPTLGYFVDYNLKTKKQSSVLFASTFYPMWAGLATPEQAKLVMKQLSELEQAGGLAMSDYESGLQWDKPYGWAPIQLIAVEGMRRYGYKADADRISRKFLTMVVQNWKKDGTIREKYNVITRTTDVDLSAGYSENVIGFGWTNGTFLALLRELPSSDRHAVIATPQKK